MNHFSIGSTGTIRHILLICDEPECGERIGLLLASHGFRTYHAWSIQDAIERLATVAIDAVYMDLRRDPQALERIRHHLDGLPVMMAVDDLHTRASQTVTLLRRPVNPETLLQSLQFSGGYVDATNAVQLNGLDAANRSLRLENGRLYDTIVEINHELRTHVAQVDVLVAKLAHPKLGELNSQQRVVLDEIVAAVSRMTVMAESNMISRNLDLE